MECQFCKIKCPIVNKDQCPIKKMLADTAALEREARESYGIHMVNLGRISSN